MHRRSPVDPGLWLAQGASHDGRPNPKMHLLSSVDPGLLVGPGCLTRRTLQPQNAAPVPRWPWAFGWPMEFLLRPLFQIGWFWILSLWPIPVSPVLQFCFLCRRRRKFLVWPCLRLGCSQRNKFFFKLTYHIGAAGVLSHAPTTIGGAELSFIFWQPSPPGCCRRFFFCFTQPFSLSVVQEV